MTGARVGDLGAGAGAGPLAGAQVDAVQDAARLAEETDADESTAAAVPADGFSLAAEPSTPPTAAPSAAKFFASGSGAKVTLADLASGEGKTSNEARAALALLDFSPRFDSWGFLASFAGPREQEIVSEAVFHSPATQLPDGSIKIEFDLDAVADQVGILFQGRFTSLKFEVLPKKEQDRYRAIVLSLVAGMNAFLHLKSIPVHIDAEPPFEVRPEFNRFFEVARDRLLQNPNVNIWYTPQAMPIGAAKCFNGTPIFYSQQEETGKGVLFQVDEFLESGRRGGFAVFVFDDGRVLTMEDTTLLPFIVNIPSARYDGPREALRVLAVLSPGPGPNTRESDRAAFFDEQGRLIGWAGSFSGVEPDRMLMIGQLSTRRGGRVVSSMRDQAELDKYLKPLSFAIWSYASGNRTAIEEIKRWGDAAIFELKFGQKKLPEDIRAEILKELEV